jgi:hypothetical protein
MSLNARKIKQAASTGGSTQAPIEVGAYPARIVQVLDLGLQAQRPYQGKEKPPVHEIMLTYELTDEFCVDEDGNEDPEKPRWISENFPLYSLEADLAKSTKRYFALDPDEVHGGDFTALIDTPCMVTVTQRTSNDRVYNNVGSVSGMRPKDAARCPELVNPPKIFLLDEPDTTIFGSLPNWMQDKIKGNLEYSGSALEKALNGGGATPKADDETPKKATKKKATTVEADDDQEGW